MRNFLIILSLFIVFLTISAQERSSITITEKGKTYYLHTVAKGEGLYRISKTYEVTIDDIVTANPHLATESLKAGESIKIPKIRIEKEEKDNITAIKTNNNGQIEHIIQPKETLYGISKRYDVTMEAIIALNPEVAAKMPIGGKLIIPQKETENSDDNNQQQTSIDTSTVTTYEVEIKQNIQDEEVEIEHQNNSHNAFEFASSYNSEIPLRIAYLLPFMTQSSKPDYKFTDFYQGALIALKEVADHGIKIEVYTFDTDKTSIKAQQVVQEQTLLNCDLIIGPAYPNQIQPVADFAYQHRINTIIPFTNKVSDISINPYLIQFNADDQSQQEYLAAYIAKNEKKAKITIIRTSTGLSGQVQDFVNALKDKKISFNDIPQQEYANRDILADKLSKTEKNLIYIDASRFSDAKEWIKLVGQLGATYNITLIGDYGWLNYATEIPTPMILVSMFLPEQNAEEYNAAYLKYYGNLPAKSMPQYDKLGYDITRYFIYNLIQNSSTQINDNLTLQNYQGLITSPQYERKSSMSGFMNQKVYILQSIQGQISILE